MSTLYVLRNKLKTLTIISLLFGSTIQLCAEFEFKIAYHETAPAEKPFFEEGTIPLNEREAESQRSVGGGSSESFSCPTPSKSTHDLSYSISSYKTEKNNLIRFEYEVNDVKGEITTGSFPIEITVKNFYFESHPNTPYILLLVIDQSDEKHSNFEMPPLKPIELETLKVEPVAAGQRR